MTQPGDTVHFHFQVSGERTLRTRPAVVLKMWDEDHADLEVEITPEESDRWGYAPTQVHQARAAGRPPVSGEWTVPRTLR
jgi:hypothetical protein